MCRCLTTQGTSTEIGWRTITWRRTNASTAKLWIYLLWTDRYFIQEKEWHQNVTSLGIIILLQMPCTIRCTLKYLWFYCHPIFCDALKDLGTATVCKNQPLLYMWTYTALRPFKTVPIINSMFLRKNCNQAFGCGSQEIIVALIQTLQWSQIVHGGNWRLTLVMWLLYSGARLIPIVSTTAIFN